MKKVITISREYGAGGHSIAKRVAEELGVELYDRDIVRETVKASGFDIEVVEQEAEDTSRSSHFLKTLISGSVHYHDPQDAIHDAQRSVILQFAHKGPCVILGRCADEILRDSDVDTLNVFIHADDLHRAMRISQKTDVTNATEIQKIMAKKDASRRNYYAYYTGKKWGDSHNYDLTLDSGTLGEDLCVKLIVQAALSDE